jgi:hypothetical protein
MGVYDKFKIVFSDVFTYFLPLVLTFLKDYGPTILEIALKIVPLVAMSVAATDATTGADSGKEKRKAAYDRIMIAAKAKGLNPPDHEVYAAIEIAVASLKEKK